MAEDSGAEAPDAGDIAIKQGGFEIDLGIVDLTPDTGKVDAATQLLAHLVLTRIWARPSMRLARTANERAPLRIAHP